MVNIILVAFLFSEALNEEEPASDVVDEGTELAGKNITLEVAITCVILYTSKWYPGHRWVQIRNCLARRLAARVSSIDHFDIWVK